MARAVALILICGSLSACSEVREVPVADLRPWKPISASCDDTAETRKQVRDHNGVYDSLKSGKRIVYADPCKDVKPTS